MPVKDSSPWPGIILLLLLFGFTLVIFALYLKRTRFSRMARGGRLPEYTKIKPVKQGDYYSILSFWSTDPTSREMIIHNIDPDAREAKMIILKTENGFVTRTYDRDGGLIDENTRTTLFEMANKFMEMRRPPQTEQPPPPDEPAETRTVEFK
jgi:hypothetical protein